MEKVKKPFYKKWWFITIVIVYALSTVAYLTGDDKAEEEAKAAEVAAMKAEEDNKREAEKEAQLQEEKERAELREKLLADAEKRAAEQETKREIDTSVFEYAEKVEVTDAIELNDHITLIISMSESTKPGMATQHVVNQTYDFVQQVDVKGAKTIGINVKQGDNKIAQFTVYTDKFKPNDDEPMSDAVIAASEIEFMTDEVKEHGKVMDSW